MKDFFVVNVLMIAGVIVPPDGVAMVGKGLLVLSGILANILIIRKNWKKHD